MMWRHIAMEPLLTTDDVATILRVDAVTVRRMVQRGELDAYRVAGEYRFSTELLQAYLARQQLSRRAADAEGTHPFSHLTPIAEQVLAHAQDAAHGLGHDYLGTEHVLLGLLAIDAGSATQALAAAGVSEAAVREQLPTLLGEADTQPDTQAARCRRPPNTGSLRVMPRLKQALERAAGEAHGDAIAPEHVLLGLLAVRGALAVGILDRLGVSSAELGRRGRELANLANQA